MILLEEVYEKIKTNKILFSIPVQNTISPPSRYHIKVI